MVELQVDFSEIGNQLIGKSAISQTNSYVVLVLDISVQDLDTANLHALPFFSARIVLLRLKQKSGIRILTPDS